MLKSSVMHLRRCKSIIRGSQADGCTNFSGPRLIDTVVIETVVQNTKVNKGGGGGGGPGKRQPPFEERTNLLL